MAAVVRRQSNLQLRLPSTSAADNNNNKKKKTNSWGICSSEEELERVCVLGHGSSGTVYKVREKKSSQVYALKIVHGNNDPEVCRQLFREMDILRRTTDSPYIVKCYGIEEKPWGDTGMVMEYMDLGTLDTLCKELGGTLSEEKVAHVARQVVNGLSYLHSHNIVHRDIKPANLLVNKNMDVKIGDFGVSRIMCPSLDACNSFVGTCAYMSPDRLDPGAYGGTYNGYAADIWSLGLTLLELFLGHFPLLQPGQRPDWASLMGAICLADDPSTLLPDSWSTVSDEFRSFIQCCLNKDSSKRWTALQLLSHPFLAN
ncbi:Mitogen-activated protein kinase kinase 9 [Turnera subulata]|uniref:mitogen-activated protein kinase kinase n=1 Tax=Turnera subulata TaxID=218843 RepID=A0A9Q0JF37_9ROSI|nr:Mitogen-activated protein kinase kinase 9 [Turnera subulata]KAJ4838772.1 Mitogen-activated protein kinase kinase 9 [Turnera subulata]